MKKLVVSTGEVKYVMIFTWSEVKGEAGDLTLGIPLQCPEATDWHRVGGSHIHDHCVLSGEWMPESMLWGKVQRVNWKTKPKIGSLSRRQRSPGEEWGQSQPWDKKRGGIVMGKELSQGRMGCLLTSFIYFRKKFAWQTWPKGMIYTKHIYYEMDRIA